MGKSVSFAVEARQRAREASAEKRAELEARERAFETVFAGLLARDEVNERISRGLHRLCEVGLTKAEIAQGTGLTASEINRLLKLEHTEEASAETIGDDVVDNEIGEHILAEQQEL